MAEVDSGKKDFVQALGIEWRKIQCRICAHKRRRDWEERLGNALNWGTVVSAFITTIVSATTIQTHSPQWLTAILAGFTAALVTAEKVFAPTKNIQALWKTQRQLEDAQGDLVILLSSLSQMKSVEEAQKRFAQISRNAGEAISMPLTETAEDRSEANKEFEGSVLHQRLLEMSSSNQPMGEVVIGDDAPGVIAVGRRRRA